MASIRELKYGYGMDLVNTIDEAFKSYGLDFEWKGGWTDVPGADPVKLTDLMGTIIINLMGSNDEITSQFTYSDREVLGNFIKEVVENYINSNLSTKPYDLYQLTSLSVFSDEFDYHDVLRIKITIKDPAGRI